VTHPLKNAEHASRGLSALAELLVSTVVSVSRRSRFLHLHSPGKILVQRHCTFGMQLAGTLRADDRRSD